MSSTEYAHPESLVSTDWVADHLNDPKVRIIESNEDVLLYDTGHIPGAVHVDWRRDLNDQTVRDYVDPKAEFFVTKDRKVQITFLDKEGKAIEPAAQVVTVTAGERSAPVRHRSSSRISRLANA